MKKIIILIFTITFLIGCTIISGNVSNTQIIKVESSVYSDKDINDGIKTVFNYFKKEYKGCKLLNIKYVGDDNNNYDDWAKRNNKEQSIAFISDYIVYDNRKVQSLNEQEYTNWNWILVRNKGERWIVVDNGY